MALVEPSGYAHKHKYGEYGYQEEDGASNSETVRLSYLSPTCDFQQCGILPSVDSDYPVQPRFKLRNCK